MGFKSIHIPMMTGQDEGIEERVLPDGKFRSVRNMRLRKDGSMARREDTTKRSHTRPDGGDVNLSVRTMLSEYGAHCESSAGLNRVVKWANVVGKDSATILPGAVSSISSIETRYVENNTATGLFQASPRILKMKNGLLVSVMVMAGEIVVDVRDSDWNLVARYKPSRGGSYVANYVQVCASVQSNRIAIYCVYALSGGAGYSPRVHVLRYDNGKIDEPATLLLGDGGVGNGWGFDICARAIKTGEDEFAISTYVPASATIKVRRYKFSDCSQVGGSDDFSITDVLPIMSSLYHDGKRLFFSYSSNSADPKIYVADSWGSSFSEGFTFGDVVPDPPINPGSDPLWDNTVTPLYVVASGSDIYLAASCIPSSSVVVGEENGSAVVLIKWMADGSTESQVYYGTLLASKPIVINGTLNIALISTFYQAGELLDNGIPDLPSGATIGTDPGERQDGFAVYSVQFSDVFTPIVTGNISQLGGDGLFPQYYPPPTPLVTSISDVDVMIVPYEEYHLYGGEGGNVAPPLGGPAEVASGTNANYDLVCAWGFCSMSEDRRSFCSRSGEAIVAGGFPFSVTERASGGFSGPPSFPYWSISGTSSDDEYLVAFVMEYRDSSGRLHRSPPSIIRRLSTRTIDGSLRLAVFAPIGMPGPSKLVMYATAPNGTTLYRMRSWTMRAGGVIWSLGGYASEPETDDILYTTLGQLPSSPAPSCTVMTMGRNRAWCAGLLQKNAVQASMVLNDSEGIMWSDLDSFKVFLPGEVTGIAAMDDAVVAFTEESVFVIHGGGPDNTGVGTFSEPQIVPAFTGCIDHKSVVSSGVGVFFLSDRGIELVPRGFGSPQWVGQAVRDTLDAYPICVNATLAGEEPYVRWLFRDSDWNTVTVCYDSRASSWYIYDYSGVRVIGALEYNGELRFAHSDGTTHDVNSESGDEPDSTFDSHYETGNIRLSGIQGWMFGRRVHLLGEWGGRGCTVRLDFAFDGEDYKSIDTYTWTPSNGDWKKGPIELELTLPVMKFSALQLRVHVTPTDEEGEFTYRANGVTLFYESAAEGPRLGRRSKG